MNKEKYRSAMDKIKADQKYQEHLADVMTNREKKISRAKAWFVPALVVCGLCLCVALGYTFVKINHILIPVSGTTAQNTASLTLSSSAAAEAGAPALAAGGLNAEDSAEAEKGESDGAPGHPGASIRTYDGGGGIIGLQTLYVDGKTYEPNRFNLNWNTNEKCLKFQGDYAGEIKTDLRETQNTEADSWAGYYPVGSKVYHVEGMAKGSAYLIVQPDGTAVMAELSSVQEELCFQEALDLFVLDKEDQTDAEGSSVYQALLYAETNSDDYTILYDETLLAMFEQMNEENPLPRTAGSTGQPLVLYFTNGGRAVTYLNLQANTLELLGKEYSLPEGFVTSCEQAVEKASKECRTYSLKDLLDYPDGLESAGFTLFRLEALGDSDTPILEEKGAEAGVLAEAFLGGALGRYRFYSPLGLCGNTEMNQAFRLELTKGGKTDVLTFITLDGGDQVVVEINGDLFGTNQQWLSTGEIWQFYTENSK